MNARVEDTVVESEARGRDRRFELMTHGVAWAILIERDRSTPAGEAVVKY